jgi:hypothetical protein
MSTLLFTEVSVEQQEIVSGGALVLFKNLRRVTLNNSNFSNNVIYQVSTYGDNYASIASSTGNNNFVV